MKEKKRDKLLRRIAKLERRNMAANSWATELKQMNAGLEAKLADCRAENDALRRGQGTWPKEGDVVKKGDLIGHEGNTGHWNPNATSFDRPEADDPDTVYGDGGVVTAPGAWSEPFGPFAERGGIRYPDPRAKVGGSVHDDAPPVSLRQTSDPVFSVLENETKYTIADNGAAEIQMPGGGVLILPAELLKDINIIHFDKEDKSE